MNTKRLVLSLGTLVFTAAVVAGGTGAFFSDTETSTGNVFTAGSVTLELQDILHTYNGDDTGNPTQFTTNPAGFNFAFADLKPLDSGNVAFDLVNGTNDAFVCARVTGTADEEVTLVGPEADLGDDLTDGELDDFLSFSFDGNVGTIADVNGQWVSLGPVAANTNVGTSVDYCFGDIVGGTCVAAAGDANIAQTDSLTADVEFYAEQVRNNPNFSCDDLNIPEPVVVDATGPFDGWNTPGATLIAQAEGRFGNNAGNGDWEIGVGNNTQNAATSENEQYVWTSGATVPFSVVYDSVSGDMTFTIDGNSVVDNVGAFTNAAFLDIVAGKVSAGSGDSVALSNLTFDGNAINPAALTDTDNTDAAYISVTSEDLSGGFTVAGDVTFTYTSGTTGSRPAFQVRVQE